MIYEQTVFGLIMELKQEHQDICAFVICDRACVCV